jgi:hypothetical protein
METSVQVSKSVQVSHDPSFALTVVKTSSLEYYRIMETLKFIAYLVGLPVAYVALVEIIDRVNRMGRR